MHSNKSDMCHSIISEIGAWAEDKNIWITAFYIQGKENYDADAESRKKTYQTGMNAQPKTFHKNYFYVSISTRGRLICIKTQCPTTSVATSYHPNPEAMHINAFSISWQDRPFYGFPPFAVIGKVLHKIVLDVAIGILLYLIGQNSHGTAP